MFHTVFQRDKRHPGQMRHPGPMHHPMHSSVANYWTETFQKREMKHDFSDDLFLNNIHLIPDPLKKNLADTLFNIDVPRNTERVHQKSEKMALNDQKVPLENMSENPQKHAGTTFSGIGSFFSGVMNVLTSVMFRSRSPNYYDCFDVDGHQASYNWQSARTDVQDKNGKADDRDDFDAPSNPNVSSDMNIDSRTAVTSCESKLNQVLHLLTHRQTSSPVWVRKRPKKAFVEPGSVSESFEDAFSPEDFSCLSDDSFVEYYSPVQHHCEDLCETAALRTQTNTAPGKQNTDCVEDVSNKSELDFNAGVLGNNEIQPEKDKTQCDTTDKVQSEEATFILNKEEDTKATTELETKPETGSTKEQLVSSCEDKLSKLKALLLEKRSKCRTKQIVEARTTPPKNIPPEKKPADKHYKNPHRRSNKRDKSKLKCRIEDDLVFANEISLGTPPSADNSPAQHNVNFGDYFDEISGRFRTVSTGSDDSFQIVFNECVNTGRVRRSSDCDSEDSFIVFEDSPDCYVSNDVLDSDSESEVSDSGCGITCKLAHTLTRTISNLADDSLYAESEDEVDFGVKCDVKERTGLELEDTSLVQEKAFLDSGASSLVKEKSGLLLDNKKKLLRKSQPAKRVQFSSAPPKVHVMRVWAFAARQARAGHWERCALDRERFKRRIADVDMAVSWVLKPQHRSRVMFQRFMPWWNQLKRKELAEKKEREALDKQREEERQKLLAENDSKAEEPGLETEEENATNKVDVTHAAGAGENQKDTAKTMVDHDTKRNIELTQHNFDLNTDKVINMEKEKLETQKSNDKNTLPVINKQCLETNNNKTQIESDKQIVSDLIISDSALAKKVQELEVGDTINYDIVS